MAEREQPYDPYIPSGGQGGAQPAAGNQRTAALQAVCGLQHLPNRARAAGGMSDGNLLPEVSQVGSFLKWFNLRIAEALAATTSQQTPDLSHQLKGLLLDCA